MKVVKESTQEFNSSAEITSNKLAERFASKRMSKQLKRSTEERIEYDGSTVMPITHYEDLITHDTVYLEMLNELQNDYMTKVAKLMSQVQKYAEIPAKRVQHLDKFIEINELKSKMFSNRRKIRVHKDLLRQKEVHFEDIAKPEFERSCKEWETDNVFEDYQKRIFDINLNFVTNIDSLIANLDKDDADKMNYIKKKVKEEVVWWNNLTEIKQANREIKNVWFQGIKTLVDRYNELKEKGSKSKKG